MRERDRVGRFGDWALGDLVASPPVINLPLISL